MAARPQNRPVSKRSSGRPSVAEAARLRVLLLDAAQALFLDQGYGATTVEQIASRIGATKRTVYAKFGDKAGLFAAMAKRLLEARRGWLAEDPPGGTVDLRLVHFGTQLLSFALAPDILALHRVLTGESLRFPELAALVARLSAQGARQRLGEVIKAEMQRGTLHVSDPAIAAELLVGMILNATMLTSLLGRQPMPAMQGRRWVEAAVALFLDGCRMRPG